MGWAQTASCYEVVLRFTQATQVSRDGTLAQGFSCFLLRRWQSDSSSRDSSDRTSGNLARVLYDCLQFRRGGHLARGWACCGERGANLIGIDSAIEVTSALAARWRLGRDFRRSNSREGRAHRASHHRMVLSTSLHLRSGGQRSRARSPRRA